MASGTLVSRLTGLLARARARLGPRLHAARRLLQPRQHRAQHALRPRARRHRDATFIPVFVERLALDGERRAWRSISSVITGAVIVLVVGVGRSRGSARPGSSTASRPFSHSTSVAVDSPSVAQQRAVATELLRWFVPQIFFYGMIGVATALLNIRHRFGVAAWVPVANNVVCIARARLVPPRRSDPDARHARRLARPDLARPRHDGWASRSSSSASSRRCCAATSGGSPSAST